MLKLTAEEQARYGRHIILEEIGLEGQEKLKNAKVLVIGLGGLGSPVSLYLAAAGVGTLGLADFDVVEEHNLQRQILHDTNRLGASKLDSAKEKLKALNPHIILCEHPEGIQVDNAVELFSQYDLIVDGTDNFPTRYLNNDAAFFAKKPLVYGSVLQFEGQVSVFDPHNGGPCYRCLFPVMPEKGSVPSCSEAGVFGALCGVIGSQQVLEAIKLITGAGTSLSGSLLVFDSLDTNFRKIRLKKDHNCPLCGDNPNIHSIKTEQYEWGCELESIEDEMEPTAVCDLLDKNANVQLLDVREDFELDIVALEGITHIPLGQLPERMCELDKTKTWACLCHHGMRSQRAMDFLAANGFENLINIRGGIDAWAVQLDDSLRRY